MAHEWDITDDDIDAWSAEQEGVDRAAAEYLAERVPGVGDAQDGDDARWLAALADTISPSELPAADEIETASAVMALQHTDWLGLALGAVQRGPGSVLDPDIVQADIGRLDDVDGEIDDLAGHAGVLTMALLHLAPRWQELGVLDAGQLLTPRGAWGLPRALHRIWSGQI